MRNIFLALLTVFVLSGCGGNRTAADNNRVASHSSAAIVTSERLMAYSVSIDMDVDNNDEAKAKITNQTKLAKGYVSHETKKSITVQIPTDGLDAFIEFLDKDVGKITDKRKSGADVTDSYDDTVSKLETLRASRDQYMDLLKKASKVDDILKIEKELERVNTAIQRLEMQKKRAETSAAYSQVSISLDDSSRGLLGWIFHGIGRALGWLF
ncbi:MAG: DUF4349 domain-containing protein [Rickettsiales bacterium]|jgi:hypothetical protein|nr:DUF4349 domain-containing protein [Rickettsiales bacterium]